MKMYLQESSEQQVDLGSLEPGMYSVNIGNETGFFRTEVVVQ